MNVHSGTPRNQPDRYIELTKQTVAANGYAEFSLSVHDGEGDVMIEFFNELMTPAGAMDRASEIAMQHQMRDVVIRDKAP